MLTSSAFKNNGIIPAEYTCDGNRALSPPLTISGVPEEAQALVLIMEDPDIPQFAKERHGIEVFDHWLLYNLPANTSEIPAGVNIGTAGLNTARGAGYTGPCPPPEHEPKEHRYIFTLYALRAPLALPAGAAKREILEALTPVVVASAELVGRYSRN